jgi:hypothetical protein
MLGIARKKIALCAGVLLLMNTVLHAATEYIPVVNGQFSTGQWYFNGKESSLAGNAGLTFVPAIRYTNRFSLIPTFESSYRGTRSAEELAGGSTLFQDTWENGVSIKAVHGLSQKWKLRERAGYRFKWFRETTDESWNDGLYDYRVINLGLELERTYSKKTSIAFGYDFSYLAFPNYESLESSQGNEFAREFSGSNVLDTRIHLLSLRSDFPLPWSLASNVQVFLSPRDYVSQHVVQRSGLFSATMRHDEYLGATLGLERSFTTSTRTRLIPSVYYGYTTMNSNQNHYDARLTHFVSDFYDYDQNRVGMQISFLVGTRANLPMIFDAGTSYSHRNYRSRTIQDADGNYGTEKLYQIESLVTLGASYPLSKNFRLRTTASFGDSSSNNNYEAVYRYNYSNSNYQFGFTYDY